MRLSEASLDDLRARNPVADIADRLGVKLRPSGRRMMGPCPICGGDPRRAGRFEAKTTDRWVCVVCQDGGDVIRLVQKALGLSFRAAVEWLGGAQEIDPSTAERVVRERAAADARRQAEEAVRREEERRRLHQIWSEAADIAGTPAWGYLVGRSIDAPGLRLRTIPEMPFYHGRSTDGRPRVIHVGPVMLAAVTRPDGRFGGLHITWLHPAFDGRKAEIFDPDTSEALPAKKMRGTVKAGRIELFRPAGPPRRLVMGEGIETTASAFACEVADEATGETIYWAAGDLGNLGGPAKGTVPHPTLCTPAGHPLRVAGDEPDLGAPAIPIPEGVSTAILLGDGDSDAFTTRTALNRAAQRYAHQGIDARIAWAPSGMDLNDLLREGERWA